MVMRLFFKLPQILKTETETVWDDHYQSDVPEMTYYSTYILYKCPVCSNVFLKSSMYLMV
jgi:hypothetical protein